MEKRQLEVEEQRQRQLEERKARENFDFAAEDESRKVQEASRSRYDNRRDYNKRSSRREPEEEEDEDAVLTEKEKQAIRVSLHNLKNRKDKIS